MIGCYPYLHKQQVYHWGSPIQNQFNQISKVNSPNLEDDILSNVCLEIYFCLVCTKFASAVILSICFLGSFSLLPYDVVEVTKFLDTLSRTHILYPYNWLLNDYELLCNKTLIISIQFRSKIMMVIYLIHQA